MKRELFAQNIQYLDPLNAGSVIGYVINKNARGRLRGEMNLSDCSRKIDWYFDQEEGLAKIDKAIALLQEFRTAWVAAKAKKARRTRTKGVR